MSESSKRRSWGWQRYFLSAAPDIVGMLINQGKISLDALEAFAQWSSGASTQAAERARDREQEANASRRLLVAALRTALTTPIDQEDLYVLSERCDRVVNSVINLLNEAEDLNWKPDSHAETMGETLHVAMQALVSGFTFLVTEPDRAGQDADTAISNSRSIDRTYRHAMASLASVEDLRSVFTSREIYRSYARSADLLTAAADRLWYAVLSVT